MIPIITLLFLLTLMLVITRIATVALSFTGLSLDLARFQARSAITGCGFTTNESEQIMHHPVRRRIIMLLMFLGNAGIVTAVASLIAGFINLISLSPLQQLLNTVVLLAGLGLLWAVTVSRWVDRHLSRLIRSALKRWTHLDTCDYFSLLHFSDGYRIIERDIQPGDWTVGQTLTDMRLSEAGIHVLGIHRASGEFVGIPIGTTEIRAGDTVILYGRRHDLEKLENPAEYFTQTS